MPAHVLPLGCARELEFISSGLGQVDDQDQDRDKEERASSHRPQTQSTIIVPL